MVSTPAHSLGFRIFLAVSSSFQLDAVCVVNGGRITILLEVFYAVEYFVCRHLKIETKKSGSKLDFKSAIFMFNFTNSKILNVIYLFLNADMLYGMCHPYSSHNNSKQQFFTTFENSSMFYSIPHAK